MIGKAVNPLPKAVRAMMVVVGMMAGFIGGLGLIEFCSVLMDDSEYRWGGDGGFTWKYTSEATYLLSLALEILLYGAAVWLVVRALRHGNASRVTGPAAVAVLGLAILSTWFDLDRPLVELLVPLVG